MTKPNWAILGLLRFVLAVIVASVHVLEFTPITGAPIPIVFLRRMDGLTAVYAFLVVSGFSIAASMERQPEGFFRRRLVRLSPSYFACLLWSLVPYILSHNHLVDVYGRRMPFTPRGEPAGEALGFAAIGFNCAFAATWPTMGQSWSLTCEIVYYALAPVFRVFNWVPWAFLVMSALYFTKSPLMGWWDYPTWAVAPCLMWMWLAGWIYYGLRKTAPGYVFLAIVLACIQLVHKIEPGTFAPLTLIITGIGFFAADRWHLPAKAARVCDWLGSVSYPLYLSHLTTCALLYYTAPAWWPHHPYLYVVAAFVVAVAIKQLIEDPVHKIMKPRRRTDEPRLGSDKPDRKATALSII